MNLKFSKMHGLGNDFLVLESLSQPLHITPAQIRAWADRHRGVGFDQLLVVAPPTQPEVDFNYIIYNADGNEVSQCGNGARCMAAFIKKQQLSPKSTLKVATQSSLLELKWVDNLVSVNMGIPQFEPTQVPLDTRRLNTLNNHRYQLNIQQTSITFTALSIGNPHGVILVDDIETADVETLGPALMAHPCFPKQANIGFVQVVDQTFIKVRVYERGAGETQACGSGACAAMIAAKLAAKVDSKIRVALTGGELHISWQGPGSAVHMCGEATHVFDGVLIDKAPEDA